MAATNDQSGGSKKVRPASASAEVLGRALNVGVAGFVFGFLGHWIGTKVGAPDVLAVIGALIGAAAGFYSLYAHVTRRLEQNRDSDSP